jgi:nicotinamidase-related amidase
MAETVSLKTSLIDVDDSILVVIDVQERFLQKLPPDEREPLLGRIGWVIDVALRLDVPLVVTAEDIPRLGSVAPGIRERLPSGTRVFDKVVFGLAGAREIVAALQATGRGTAILVGLETDVCVAHSALGLLQLGYQVAVVADATGSPGAAQRLGLERMRRAGVLVSSVKGLYYEWVLSGRCRPLMRSRFGRPRCQTSDLRRGTGGTTFDRGHTVGLSNTRRFERARQLCPRSPFFRSVGSPEGHATCGTGAPSAE